MRSAVGGTQEQNLLVVLRVYAQAIGFTLKLCGVEVPLCERHKNHWLMRKLLVLLSMLGVFALGVVPVIAAFAADPRPNDPFAIACLVGWVVLLLGWIILAIVVQATTIRTNEITDTYIRLVSVSEEFAAACKKELPDVRGLLDRAARERWNDGERRADKKDEKTPLPGPATWDIKI
jgi:hypothetical protein